MRKKLVWIMFFFFCFSMIKNANAQSNYVVKKGDTLWEIAVNHHISLNRVISSNQHIMNPNLIFPGQRIIIPSMEGITEGEYKLNNKESKLIELLNSKRAQLGLKPLSIDPSLSNAAKLKSVDMMENDYLSHLSPTYGNPSEMLKDLQVPFRKVKENIGAGHSDANQIFVSWMNTATNRANILNEKATSIGISYAEGGLYGHYWTIFITEK